jgi:hypothetical protein
MIAKSCRSQLCLSSKSLLVRGWLREIEGMNNPGLPPSLWAQLDGRLWHATGSHGLIGIVADGQIRVSTSNRYPNSFCRSRGCVSLFDFGDEASDQGEFEFSNWFSWLGREHDGRCAVWLEVDRVSCGSQLISPSLAREIARREQSGGKLFTGVEACHKGPISSSQILGALFIDRHDPALFEWCNRFIGPLPAALSSFCQTLPVPPPEHPLEQALRSRKQERQNDHHN